MLILLILTNIVFWIIILLIENVKNHAKALKLSINCLDSIDKMLNKYNILLDNIKLEKGNTFSYSPKKNSIKISNFQSCSAFDIISASHEVGHYVTINSKKSTKDIYKISQYVIAINRLIVIPLYFIFSLGVFLDIKLIIFISQLFKEIIILYFFISTLLKLTIYFPHEIL